MVLILSAKNKKVAEAVLKEMKASLINAVNKALELFFDDIVKQMNMKMDSIKEAVQKSALLAHYEADKLEQYSRRESFRISGMNIPDEADSSELIEMVCKLAGDIGVDLEKKDFVACHTVGAGNRKQVLSRLTTRVKKEEIMKNKQKLKTDTGRRIFVNEDITPLRYKLLKLVKEKEEYKKAYTMNGKIVVYDVNEKKRVYIDNPDDLFKIGIDIDNEILKKLGLSNYLA